MKNQNKITSLYSASVAIVALAGTFLFLVFLVQFAKAESLPESLAEISGVPASSGSGNNSSGSSVIPASSNSTNTYVPTASNSTNNDFGGSVPGASNSTNSGGTATPAASNSTNNSGGSQSAPASSNSNNNSSGGATNGPPAPAASGGGGGGGSAGNGPPFALGSYLSQFKASPAVNSVSVPPSVSAVNTQSTAAKVCKSYLNDYLSPKAKNNPAEVTKLQQFLTEQGFVVDINGNYDEKTTKAVENFQLKYANDILNKSWGVSSPTGEVYITTKLKINDLVCGQARDFKTLSYLGSELVARNKALALKNSGLTSSNLPIPNSIVTSGTGLTVSNSSNTTVTPKVSATSNPATTSNLAESSTSTRKNQRTSVAEAFTGLWHQFGAVIKSVFGR